MGEAPAFRAPFSDDLRSARAAARELEIADARPAISLYMGVEQIERDREAKSCGTEYHERPLARHPRIAVGGRHTTRLVSHEASLGNLASQAFQGGFVFDVL